MRRASAKLGPYLAVGVGFAVLTAGLAPILEARSFGFVAMLYLLVTLGTAARWGYGPGFAAALLANALVNFFFVAPVHRFTVAQPFELAGLGVFLTAALLGAYMLSRLREHAHDAAAREAETATLLRATQDVAHASSPRQALERLCEALARVASARGCALLVGDPLTVGAATMDERSAAPPTRDELAVAREAARAGTVARLAAGASNQFSLSFVPVQGDSAAVLRLIDARAPEAIHSAVFHGLMNELSGAVERSRLSASAARAAELERADTLNAALLSSVSHDLRTPLTAIKAAVSSLRDEAVRWPDEDRAAFLETVESETDRLTRTVANLLELSRIESGAARPRLEAVALEELLAEAALATRYATAGREVRLRAEASGWVRADYGLILQALVNLIENACRYSIAGGAIELAGAARPGRGLILVSDAGPGIAPDDLPRVFEKFYRGKGTRSGEGSGMGLALVKTLVEFSGGSVSVESGPCATTFTISLPAATAPR